MRHHRASDVKNRLRHVQRGCTCHGEDGVIRRGKPARKHPRDRSRQFLIALALLAGCDKSANISTTITYTPQHAQVRMLVLLPDAASLGAFVDVPNDLATAWDLSLTGEGPTAFLPTVTSKSWTVEVTKNEVSIGSAAVMSPTAGAYYTYVVAPETAQGSAGVLNTNLALTEVPAAPPSATVASVDFISGLPAFQGGTVTIGETTIPGMHAPGAVPVSPLTTVPPGATTVTLTPPMGSAVTFSNVMLPAGNVTTLALVGGIDAASAKLLVVTDTFTSTTITPSVQTLMADQPATP
jgi:hypothetical protein